MRTRSAAVAVLVSAPGGGTQLITVVAPTPSSPPSRRSNQVTVLDVASRKQGTQTTPSGLYGLPYAFGIKAAPSGTSYKYRAVKRRSWSFQDNASRSRNRWVEPRPRTAGPRKENLFSCSPQYAYALVIGFNYDRPVRKRGAGIFLHVNGRGNVRRSPATEVVAPVLSDHRDLPLAVGVR
jgi:hypothetical protein